MRNVEPTEVGVRLILNTIASIAKNYVRASLLRKDFHIGRRIQLKNQIFDFGDFDYSLV